MRGNVTAILLALALLLTSPAVPGQQTEIRTEVGSTGQLTEHISIGVGSADQLAEPNRIGVASDWTQHHLLFPAPKDLGVLARVQGDPRWLQQWFLRHHEAWWPQRRRGGSGGDEGDGQRDWSMPVGSATFEPLFDFNFDIAPQTGYGSLNSSDEFNGTRFTTGEYLATAGSLTVTGGSEIGTYPLYPFTGYTAGEAYETDTMGPFYFDNLITAYYPSATIPLDYWGLLFATSSMDINIWYTTTETTPNYEYTFQDGTSAGQGTPVNAAGPVNMYIDPGGGQTFPAKYTFSVTTNPSCSDFVVMGIPANAAAGGQANIVGWNNLYITSGGVSGSCPLLTGETVGQPNVLFAYASGSGEVPAAVALSLNGQQVAYVENRLTGSSYFHVLTIGTTAYEGSSPTSAVTPGSGKSNAVDTWLQLTPDGTTNQSSTTAPWIEYTSNAAYVTTYNWSSTTPGTGTGFLYKISGVFHGGTPAIVTTNGWPVQIDAVPSSPVYDSISNKVFFTDSNGRIDYVEDNGSPAAVTYGAVVASGTTSLNPVTVDTVYQKVYATFNTNGANAIVVQAPTSLASSTAVNIGTGTNTFTGPYGVDFNNSYYNNGPGTTGTPAPMLFVAGTGTGTLPTLYGVPFTAAGAITATGEIHTPLATGAADASPVTEFYNPNANGGAGEDFLFVGVTNHCEDSGVTGAGCVMNFNITNPLANGAAPITALAATGGSSGIIIDNDANTTNYPQASSCYYATKTGATLVKATQSGLK